MYNGHASVFTMWCCILMQSESQRTKCFWAFRACFNYKKNNVWQEQYFNSYWNQAVPNKRSNMQTFLCVIQKEQGLHSWIWPLNREHWSPGFVWVFFIREGGWKTPASCWGHTGLTADWKTTAAGFTALCWSITTALKSEAEKHKILV